MIPSLQTLENQLDKTDYSSGKYWSVTLTSLGNYLVRVRNIVSVHSTLRDAWLAIKGGRK